LCSRHREAVLELQAEEYERLQKDQAVLVEKEEEARRAYSEALGQLLVMQAAFEAAQIARGRYVTPPRAPSFIEGTIEEVLEVAKASAALTVDPLSLTETLLRLEESQRGAAFPKDGGPHEGHLIIKYGGKMYVPCIGRAHVDFDLETGQVTDAKILSLLAIEAQSDGQEWVVVEGAAPVDRHSLQD